jgi:hypothetical protein
MDTYQDIKFPPTWGTSTPPDYAGPGDPLQQAVEALVPSGEVTELIVLEGTLGGRQATLSGYFDDPRALEEAARLQDGGGAKAIFTTLNRLRPDPARTVANRLGFAKTCAGDQDFDHFRIILLDLDQRMNIWKP